MMPAAGSSNMRVRPLRLLDLVPLASFLRRGGTSELTAHTWPGVEPDSGPVPYASLLAGAIARGSRGRRAWVARDARGLAGLAVARPRAGGLAWDAEHVFLAEGEDDLACALLDEAVAAAGAHGARRVFLTTPERGAAGDLVRRAAFDRFSQLALYGLPPGFRVERTDLFEARPRLRADEQPLFQLFTAAVPAGVRAAEALTPEEWAGLYTGARPWRPSLTGTRQQFVWELGASLVGWMEVTFGQRSQFVELLVHPRYEDAADRLVRWALLQVSPKAPVYLAVREYQPALASAVDRAGFREAGRYTLFVKMLAVRVREPRLVPAGVAGA